MSFPVLPALAGLKSVKEILRNSSYIICAETKMEKFLFLNKFVSALTHEKILHEKNVLENFVT